MDQINSQKEGLCQLKHCTAEPSVRQSLGCLFAHIVTPLFSHLHLRAAEDTCNHSVFIHLCCLSPVVQDFEKGELFILLLV